MSQHAWSTMPLWEFCWVEPHRCVVKVALAIEPPVARDRHRDGPFTCETLWSSADKLVGYRFKFQPRKELPHVRQFKYAVAATYGTDTSENFEIVLAAPHVRVLRLGSKHPTYLIVLRRKEKNDAASEA